MNKQKLVIKILGSALMIILVGIIALTALSIFGIPKNFRIFVVETGSMTPAIPTGSLAFVSPQNSYFKGDVITFNTPIEADEKKDYVVTHRVNDIKYENGEVLYQTKGDANNTPDNLWTNQIRVVGKVVGSVPYVGYVVGFAKTQIGFLLLIIIPSLIIVYTEIQNILKEYKKMQLKKKLDMSQSNRSENYL